MGTVAYMSPEQLESSKNVDARTDIWALGIVLYALGIRERYRRGQGESPATDNPLAFLEYCQTLGAGGGIKDLSCLSGEEG